MAYTKKKLQVRLKPLPDITLSPAHAHVGFKYNWPEKVLQAKLLPNGHTEVMMQRELSYEEQLREATAPFVPNGNQIVLDGTTLITRMVLSPQAISCIAHYADQLQYNMPPADQDRPHCQPVQEKLPPKQLKVKTKKV